VIPYDYDDAELRDKTARRNDVASAIMVRMADGSIAKLLQVGLRGHGVWVRIHGNRGLMETLRWGQPGALRIRREPFDKEPGEPEETVYVPDFPEHHEEAVRAGHGGGDFFMDYHFAQAIRTNTPPYLDVYRGVAMSIVGPLAYRSALADSTTIEVPDFRQPAMRAQYAADDWSPDPAQRRQGQPWPSVLGDIQPSAEGLAFAQQVWEETHFGGMAA